MSSGELIEDAQHAEAYWCEYRGCYPHQSNPRAAMIVTLTGIVVLPPDPVYPVLSDTAIWVRLSSVSELFLVRNDLHPHNRYLFIHSCNARKMDYYAIKEKLLDDIRCQAQAGPTR